MDRRERLDDIEESLRLALDNKQSQIWTAIPAIVNSVNLNTQTVSVQPTIQAQQIDEMGNVTNTNLPLLVDVPICWPKAGGFALTLPVTSGDEVLIVFSSRCIDTWWQSGGIGTQAEIRMHDLSDGFAILAPTSQPKVLPDVQTDGIELRNESRSTYIKLTDTGIEIKGNITHDGTILHTGQITGEGGISVSGGGGFVMSGNIVHTGTITSNDKNIGSTHVHSGVTSGTSNTGAPT